MFMVILWWIFGARKWFKGPKVCLHLLISTQALDRKQVNIEHQMSGREGNMVDGKDHDSGGSTSGSMIRDGGDFDKNAADITVP